MPRSRVAKKEVVKFIIKETLRRHKVGSQSELAGIVARKLKIDDKKYSITGERARMLALEIPVRVMIKNRCGRPPKRCPSCKRGLKKTYSKNLLGKKILIRLSCPRCGYSGSGGKWIPARYEFEKL
jgi:hypothetical protein